MMLDKELAQIVNELTHISEATDTIRKIAEQKRRNCLRSIGRCRMTCICLRLMTI